MKVYPLTENVVSQDDYFIYFGKFNLPASTQLIKQEFYLLMTLAIISFK